MMENQRTRTIEINEDDLGLRLHDIIIAPDPRLKKQAERVKEITFAEHGLLELMKGTLRTSDGIGLAATQLGIQKRIIVLDVEPLEAYNDGDTSTVKHGAFEMVNPVIISREGRARWIEGCLSVPGYKDIVERDLVIEVSYLDRDGEQRQLRASGLLSACIQHEIDHLDGVLFIDHLSRLRRDMVVSKLKKLRKRGIMVIKPSKGNTM